MDGSLILQFIYVGFMSCKSREWRIKWAYSVNEGIASEKSTLRKKQRIFGRNGVSPLFPPPQLDDSAWAEQKSGIQSWLA